MCSENEAKEGKSAARMAVTRRGFLKGAGLSAAGATLLHSGLVGVRQAAAADPRAGVHGPGAVPMALRVNGRERQVAVEPRTTLAEALRDQLELTGTKVVCDRGACSACTVFLEGTPICSCMTLAIEVGKREITTVEGIAGDKDLHPVQAAFIECDASMCGFCTPGMVMSCAALLKRNPQPSAEDVKTAVSGNLCRCGTYPKIFEAMASAAKKGAAV
jgi:aerobic-type carbon monoxide dehydrogenase small subunit (CoxS/CutS family)